MATDESGSAGLDFERLYAYRFKDVDQAGREKVWGEIARFAFERMGRPRVVLDPAAGRGEFINAVPAEERWGIDLVEQAAWAPEVRRITGDALRVELPVGTFDGVFVSNFLEHLPTQEVVAQFLGRMRTAMAPTATIAIMGPNFKYCPKEYFDCADHVLALTHVSVEEHLAAAGFTGIRVVPRLLPYSFRGVLPPSARLTKAYLRFPPAWRLLGKQFFITARRG